MNRDLASGLGALVLAAGYYAMAASMPASALADAVGPQGLPQVYAMVLGGLSIVLIVRGLRRTPVAAEEAGVALRRPAGLIAIGAGYLAVVSLLGYVVSLAGLIAATVYYQGGVLDRRVVLIAVSGALCFWLLFVGLLGIPHPPGFWRSLF